MSDMEADTATRIPLWTLGDRLRKAREAAGITQEEMAGMLEKSRGAVSSWEGDQHRPDALAIRAWAAETNVPVWWLTATDVVPHNPAVTRRYPHDGQRLPFLLAA